MTAYHELGNLLYWNTLLLQNGPLMHRTPSSLGNELRLLSMELPHSSLLLLLGRLNGFGLRGGLVFGENRRTAISLNLVL